jgi:hypothetical protein
MESVTYGAFRPRTTNKTLQMLSTYDLYKKRGSSPRLYQAILTDSDGPKSSIAIIVI